MLSRPGALPDFNFLMAASSYSTVKSDDRLASAVAALESEVTSRDVQRAKSLSASGKRPLFRSCEAIAFAVTGHLECIVLLPVSLFMVCQALRLECVKSTDSTTSVHLALRTLSSVWSSAVAVVSMSPCTDAVKHDWHIVHDTTNIEVPPCRLKSRKPYNKEAQKMLSVIPEDRSKDAWIAATWKRQWPPEYTATYRTQDKVSREKI